MAISSFGRDETRPSEQTVIQGAGCVFGKVVRGDSKEEENENNDYTKGYTSILTSGPCVSSTRLPSGNRILSSRARPPIFVLYTISTGALIFFRFFSGGDQNL